MTEISHDFFPIERLDMADVAFLGPSASFGVPIIRFTGMEHWVRAGNILFAETSSPMHRLCHKLGFRMLMVSRSHNIRR